MAENPMESVSTSAMHEAAYKFSRSYANDRNFSIGVDKKINAATISSLDGYFATVNHANNAW